MNDADIESIAQMASLANNQITHSEYDSPEQEESKSGTKRKAEDGGQPQQRAKRNRYISIACNEVGAFATNVRSRNLADSACSANDEKLNVTDNRHASVAAI